jgi:hypothetical protein
MSSKNQKKKLTTAFGIPVGDDQNSFYSEHANRLCSPRLI